jgi:hypothetical protein
VNTKSKWAYTLGVSVSAIVALVLSFAMSGARRLSGLDALIISATKRVLIPSIAAIFIIAVICLIFRSRAVFNRIAPRTAQTVVWMPPLLLWLWQASPWTILPACLLSASAVARLRLGFVRGLPASFLVSALLQWGAVLWMVDREVKAALVLALGTVVLHLLIRTKPPLPHAPVRDWSRTAGAVVASFVLTIAALLPTLMGGAGGASAANGAYPGTPPKMKQDPGNKARPVPSAEEVVAETHRGILLFPEEEPYVRLVPPLPMMGHGLKKMSKTEPLSIPFFGVYWLFRQPYKEPPKGSHVVRGAPDTKGFRSGDFIPLTMEAHQNFGKLIDVSCCKQIRVAIRNADRFPSAITMELILVNTALPKKPSLSLGRAAITTSPAVQLGPAFVAAPEVLQFDVPLNATLKQFDKVTVVFHRTALRSYRSARIAIDRFILLPRGCVKC